MMWLESTISAQIANAVHVLQRPRTAVLVLVFC